MYLYELQDFFARKVSNKNIYVVPYDKLPEKFTLPAGFVVNLSKASEVGSHWTSFYIDVRGRGSYFDSYGFKPPHKAILQFLKIHSKEWTYNNHQYQQLHSKVCGMYAAIFIFYISNNISLDLFKKQFSKNLTINDYVVAKIYEKLNN